MPSSAIGGFIIGESPIGIADFEPTTTQNIIPSYLYWEYDDDDNLQAFVKAYNDLAQEYLDWFNQVQLPVYTGELISGDLLDWVAEGLYGLTRPVLPSGHGDFVGPYNTLVLNLRVFNFIHQFGPSNYYLTTDDVFKRCLTWAFYKGDGKVFNVRWLKRRVMRFLFGTDGTSYNIDETYPVSVRFSGENQVDILLLEYTRTIVGGALFNRFALNTTPFNQLVTKTGPVTPIPFAATLKAAIASGVLELPFQFQFNVIIN